jgi:hypothetical protein
MYEGDVIARPWLPNMVAGWVDGFLMVVEAVTVGMLGVRAACGETREQSKRLERETRPMQML